MTQSEFRRIESRLKKAKAVYVTAALAIVEANWKSLNYDDLRFTAP